MFYAMRTVYVQSISELEPKCPDAPLKNSHFVLQIFATQFRQL